MRDSQKKRDSRRRKEEGERRRGTEGEGQKKRGQYPGRGVRVQQVFDLLVVDLQKHDAHRTV